MPKISVIIPLYNAKNYLRACLDSVQNQTFTDFECLCVNDGSKDETPQIVEEYVKKDPRFRLITKVNAGCSMARNTGIDEAKSPYICFLDQDDMYHPQALELLYHLIEKENADVASFKYKSVPDEFVMPKDLEMKDVKTVPYKVITDPYHYFMADQKGHGSQVEIWVRIYKRESVKGLYFPKDIQPAEDTIYSLRVMNRIKKFVLTQEEYLFYRISKTSIMQQGTTNKYILRHTMAGQVLHDDFVASHILSEEDEKVMRKYIARMLYKTCISQPLRRRKTDKKEGFMYSYSLLKPLLDKGVFSPCLLKRRHAICIYFFMKKCFRLARLFV